jgi:2-amino-4-hydroxy-6-hydroxymethyldihydropteridine diphosphokinase
MQSELTQYVLLTGSDLGDRALNLSRASELIAEHVGRVVESSSVIESEPWGFESDTKFLNQALLIESELNAETVLQKILKIEADLGRVRQEMNWASRIIDIDILCADQLIHHSETLKVPHEHLHERQFALRPLCELVPEWKHPLVLKSYVEILSELVNQTSVPQF